MITVYGSKNGFGCKKAMELLDRNMIAFEFKRVDIDIGTKQLLTILDDAGESFQGLPVIVWDNEILTYSDLKRKLR